MGVSSLADLQALAALGPIGVEGAVVGKALYAGAFTLTEALAAVSSAPLPDPQLELVAVGGASGAAHRPRRCHRPATLLKRAVTTQACLRRPSLVALRPGRGASSHAVFVFRGRSAGPASAMRVWREASDEAVVAAFDLT